MTTCIYYNKYFIYFNTFYDHLFYNQITLPTPIPNAEFTRHFTVFTRRAHNALEDPTAQTPSANTMQLLKINAAAWNSRRLHMVSIVSELIPKLRFHYISLHWISDYLPLSLNQERF